jgi:hypothetical protein
MVFFITPQDAMRYWGHHVSDMVYESPDKDGFSKIGPYATGSYSLVLRRGSLGRPRLSFSSPGYLPVILFS